MERLLHFRILNKASTYIIHFPKFYYRQGYLDATLKFLIDSAYIEDKDSMKTNDDLYDLDLSDDPLDDFRDSDDYLF